MSHNLILAQNNAFNLAQMLMAPVTLFQNNGQLGSSQNLPNILR